MLQESQMSGHDDVLKHGARRNVDGATVGRDDDDGALERHFPAKVDSTGDCEVIELDDVRDARNAGLEAGDFLKVTAELDERGRAEAVRVHDKLAVLKSVEVRLDQHEVRAGLDRQESAAGNVDTMGIAEVPDGSADGGLELENAYVGLALLVCRDGLFVGDDFHAKLVVFNHALDRTEVHPDVVGVKVLELLDRLELVDMLLWHLGDFQQADGTLVVDYGATLDVRLCLIRQFHDVLGLCVDHVLQDAEVDDGTEVVGVREEDDFDAPVDELVKYAGIVERLEDVTVAWRVPVFDLGVGVLWHGQERVLEDTRIP